MNTPIRTNKLVIDLDVSAIDIRYDIFKIETDDGYFKHGAYVLDVPQLCNNISSVYFIAGCSFYVLMLKCGTNKTILTSALHNAPGGDKITLSKIDASDIDKRVMTSLLLNAVSSYDSDFLRFNNLTGHLYCFSPSWIKKGKYREADIILKIPCIEIAISDDFCLTLNVRTFTSEVLKNKIKFNRKKFEDYPKYILAANNSLRRKLGDDKEKCFIMRQTTGDKSEIPFLDIKNKQAFESSKMGILQKVLAIFNDKYTGVCGISFSAIDDYKSVNSPKSLVKENSVLVKNLLNSNPVRIVDCIVDDYSSRFCYEIRKLLNSQYNVNATIGKRISKNSLNLCVIHNAIYYDGSNDPHDKKYRNIAVQHITLEDFMGNEKAAISTVAHELLIKNDINNGFFSLFDWSKTGITENISFGVKTYIQDIERFFFMDIRPDGTFEFSEQKLDLFSVNKYSECLKMFSDARTVSGVIRYADGSINVIRETPWFTIPEIDRIKELLDTGDTYLRGTDRRHELLESVTDIKCFTLDGKQYFFVGIIGEGMRTSVNTSANIRAVEAYENSSLRFDELLPLMNVTFVRNGQLTVLPFPFKYLREYIKTIAE